jgi:sterol-4alpha-carboxylate 3-dehydrogenase (decarboxylating)
MAEEINLGTILIVGGTGLLGHHLAQDLIEYGIKGDHIHVIDLHVDRNRIPIVSYHQADITSKQGVRNVFQQVKPRVVFHAASPNPFENNRKILDQVNIIGTRNLIDSAKEMGTVKAFVYVSSSSVVHDHYHPLINADENLPVLYYPQQPSYYSHTKAIAEDIVLAANRSVATMLTVAVRPASMYGEGDEMQIPNQVRNAKAGRARNQIGPGNNKFDNTYVKNLAHAQILAAKALVKAADEAPLSKNERVEGEAFFVTDDGSYTFWETSRLIAEFAGYPVKPEDIRKIPYPLVFGIVWLIGWAYWVFTFGKEMAFSTRIVRMFAQERTFCIDKIRTRLGYRARYTTAEGMKRSVVWYLEHQDFVSATKKGN